MTTDDPTDVVLGAGSGMGAATARRLARPDRRLLLADRDVAAAEAVAADLPGSVEVVACDLLDQASIGALAETTGPLGALVVTAGLSPNMADGRRVVEVNLLGSARVLDAFEPHVVAGSVAVLFASMAAHSIPADAAVDAILDDPTEPALFDGLAGLGLLDHSALAYAVSKRGVVRLVERRAGRWGALGGRLLSVSPGIIDTPMGRLESANEAAMDTMVAASALRREGAPDELASVVAFLVSDDASFLTGTDVLVDGGAVAAMRFPTVDG